MTTSVSARYDTGTEQVRRLTGRFLAAHPGPAGRFVGVLAGPGEPLATVGRSVERAVAEERHGAHAAALAQTYDGHERDSRFLLVLDRDRGGPAGLARVVADTGHGTPALRAVPRLTGVPIGRIRAAHGMDDGGRIWEYAAMAVLPRYRGKRSALTVTSLLYRMLLRLGRAEDVRHVVAVMDAAGYRNARLLGIPAVPMTGSRPFPHRGVAENYALYGDFPRFEVSITAQATRLRRA
jgi:GNAT superfamily N-acetyltransferase